jgi:hypothetical protein
VFPTAGYVSAMPAVLFPLEIEDEKGVTTTVMAAMTMTGTDEAKARAAASGAAGEDLCTQWLKLLGLEGVGVAGWREACYQVGLDPMVLPKPGKAQPVARPSREPPAPPREEEIKPSEKKS